MQVYLSISQCTPDEQKIIEQSSLLFALGRHSRLPENLLGDLMKLVDMGYIFFHQFSPSEILQRGLGIVLFVCHVLINIYVVHT